MWTSQSTLSALFLVLVFSYVSCSTKLKKLGGKHPSCSVKPQWEICKYHYIQWQREYKWRAYYDPKENDCFYYRGCPTNNKELFEYDVDCREACVSGGSKLVSKPVNCFTKPILDKCSKMVTRYWYDESVSKCKKFRSCHTLNKRFWNTESSCYGSCLKKTKLNKNGLSRGWQTGLIML